MKTFIAVAHSLLPVFAACVGGLYIYQALNEPKRIFSRRECWAIGLSAELVAVLFSLNNRFQYFC